MTGSRQTMPRVTISANLPFIAAIVSAIVSGCASVSTRVSANDNGAVEDGVIYYMPSRPFKITVSMDKGDHGTPSVAAGDSIPDRTRHFVLKYNRNLFGTNHAVISINSKGLLQSSNSTTTSSADAIAKAIGTLAGTVRASAAPAGVASPAPGCKSNQTYTLMVSAHELGQKKTLCGYEVSGGLFPSAVPNTLSDSNRVSDVKSDQDGIFYKRDLPYLVVLTDTNNKDANGNSLSTQYIAYSPDEAAISFLPVNKTLLANNSTNVTLSDGTLTQVDESTDSDLLAVLTFPANVISGYFAAVGQVFQSLGNNAQNQSNMLKNEDALRATQAQVEVCKRAIANNELTGKTDKELASAIANIKAACGG